MNQARKVTTRVAPSPTGDPHVGTAYMALFSLCYARQHAGDFILRIEDTDAARSSRASEQKILDSLRWLGLNWDQGPDVGGPHGPYRQSERLDIYHQYIKQLLTAGHAFRCFCTPERLQQMRAAQISRGETARYDGQCLQLPDDEVQTRMSAGETSVVRMCVPEEGVCTLHDELRGDIEIDWQQVDMQVLLKADGNPTYHLAVVVDDHLMEVTHVIRGEEWINSAPKHQLLYRYFDWPMPRLIHLPLLRNPDKSKLSKRKNPTSIHFYERMGFLPEALLNYLGMLGWSMPDEEEKFSLTEMIEHFDIRRIALGAPVFDMEKLKWLNGRWLRESLDEHQFAERIIHWAYNRENLQQVVPLIQSRVEVFSEVAPMISFLASGLPEIEESSFDFKQCDREETRKILQFSLWQLDRYPPADPWNADALKQIFTRLSGLMKVQLRDMLAPIFVAISGKPVAPPLFDSIAILGPDMTRARLTHALDMLGGVSKKQKKKLEKDYQQLQDNP